MIKLTIEIDGKEYKIDVEQAKKLQSELNLLLGEQTQYIPYPITNPQPWTLPYNPITYPQVTYGTCTTTSHQVVI